MSPSKSSDSGFSDSANGDHESLEDKRSDAGDSGIMSTCESKKSSSVLSATSDKAGNTNSDAKGTPGDDDSDSSGALSATGDKTDNTNNNNDNTNSNTGDLDSSGALSATDDKTNTTTNDSDNSNTGDSDSSGALSATGDKTNNTNSGSDTVDTDMGSSDVSFTDDQNNDADKDSNVVSDPGVCIKGSNSVSAAVGQGGIPDEDVGDSKTEADSASNKEQGSDEGMN